MPVVAASTSSSLRWYGFRAVSLLLAAMSVSPSALAAATCSSMRLSVAACQRSVVRLCSGSGGSGTALGRPLGVRVKASTSIVRNMWSMCCGVSSRRRASARSANTLPKASRDAVILVEGRECLMLAELSALRIAFSSGRQSIDWDA